MVDTVVSNAAELNAAIKTASGGDVILLESGDYGRLEIIDQDFSDYVTIRSVDDSNMGRIHSIEIDNSSFIRFDSVHVEYQTNSERARFVDVKNGSEYIDIINSEINGPVDSTFVGRGIYTKDSDHLTITGNYIHDVEFALAAFAGSDITVSENYVNRLGVDFMKGGGIYDFQIINNTGGGDIYPEPTWHADFIQFQGSSSDGVIRGNVWIANTSERAQGIFLDDGEYHNITIEQNIIFTGKNNGIRIYEGTGNVVRDNTVLATPGVGHHSSYVAVPDDSIVENNIWTLSHSPGFSGSNLVVQWHDENGDYHYSDYFVGFQDHLKGLGEVTLADLVPIPGSAADGRGAHERLLQLLNDDGTPGNTRPDAVADATTTDEDSAVIIDVLDNDSDLDGDAFEVTNVGSAAHGTAALNPDGTITYVPDADYAGADSFSYTIRDENGGTDTASVTVDVTPVNDDPPDAVDDSFYAASGEATTINVLVNDTDPDGEALTIDSYTQPSHGSIVYLGNGEFAYTANQGHFGTDSFTYTLRDSAGLTDSATVDLNVLDLGDIPTPIFGESAHDFAGNTSDAIILPQSPAYELANGTLEIVFTADAQTARQGIFSKDSSHFDGGGHLTILLEGDEVLVRLQSTSATYEVRLANAVTVGTEHHLAVVFGDGGMEVYLDGSLAGTNAYTGGLLGNPEPIVIGANQWASGDQVADNLQDAFNGSIAKVNLYDRGLSAEEIQFLSGSTDDPPSDAPGAPIITSFSSDSGVVGDGITNDDTLTLNGTAEADSTVTVYDGAALLGTVLADGNGDWDYTTVSLAEGTHGLTATATDAAGNTGVASSALDVIIDTTVPNAPVITDSVANGNTVALTGTAEPNSIVDIYKDGIWFDDTSADANGDWSYTSGPLADGNYSIVAKATDAADNTSEASAPVPIAVDARGDIEAPIITSFSSDSGVVGDGITSDDTLTLNGTAEADSTVTVYDGAVLLGTVLADGNGDWDFTTVSLAQGAHSFTATATDAADNTSVASTSLDVTIDNPIDPGDIPAPIFSEGTHDFAGNTSDAVILPHGDAYELANGTLEIVFTADALTTRQGLFSKDSSYFDDGGHLTILMEGDDLLVRLQSSTASYEIRLEDAVTTGTEHHLAVVIGDGGMKAYLDGSLVGTNAYTGGLLGNAEPIVVGANQWASGDQIADKIQNAFNGSIAEVNLYDQGLTAEQIQFLSDAGGLPPDDVPDAPTIGSFASDSGAVGDGITNDDTLTLSGTAEADSTATIYDGAAVLGTVSANGGGDWSYTTGPLADGAHSFTATATDAAGDTSVASATLDVTIDTTAPNAPTDTDDAANAVAENAVNGSDVGLTAFADDAGGEGVTYSLDDNAGGRFAIDPNSGVVTVADGSLLDYESNTSHTITVRATDQAGNFSTSNFDIDETSPGGEAIAFAATNFSSYWNQDLNRDLTISDDGTTLELSGNTWVKYDYPYTVSEDTLLVFEFRADSEAEIHGIGVDTDNDLNTLPDQFNLFGSQNPPYVDGFVTDFKTYGSTGEWVQYQISLGDYVKGDIQYLTFVHDNDAGPQNEVSYFRNVQLVEASAATRLSEEAASGQVLVEASVATPPPEEPASGPVPISEDAVSGQVLIGTSKSETLLGGAGDDTLAGRKGNDKLIGKAGSDIFLFNTKLNAETNVDRIKDFSVSEDTIQLDKDDFANVGKAGTLSEKRFEVGKKADDKADRVIYHKNKGKLLYDKDGKGGDKAVKFALVDDNLNLTNDDFVIVS
ncbi:MAG: tandem-95 repeat protein [bacterium]|nr:tandem-95 repeat protein [bacterium]